jgi:hypothetical protein
MLLVDKNLKRILLQNREVNVFLLQNRDRVRVINGLAASFEHGQARWFLDWRTIREVASRSGKIKL